jgi:hypothetical protein
MATPITLPVGDHDLMEPIKDWLAHFVDAAPPTVQLIALVQSDPMSPAALIRDWKGHHLGNPNGCTGCH